MNLFSLKENPLIEKLARAHGVVFQSVSNGVDFMLNLGASFLRKAGSSVASYAKNLGSNVKNNTQVFADWFVKNKKAGIPLTALVVAAGAGGAIALKKYSNKKVELLENEENKLKLFDQVELVEDTEFKNILEQFFTGILSVEDCIKNNIHLKSHNVASNAVKMLIAKIQKSGISAISADEIKSKNDRTLITDFFKTPACEKFLRDVLPNVDNKVLVYISELEQKKFYKRSNNNYSKEAYQLLVDLYLDTYNNTYFKTWNTSFKDYLKQNKFLVDLQYNTNENKNCSFVQIAFNENKMSALATDVKKNEVELKILNENTQNILNSLQPENDSIIKRYLKLYYPTEQEELDQMVGAEKNIDFVLAGEENNIRKYNFLENLKNKK